MAEEIINKISQSELLTLDPEQFYPVEGIQVFDLKPYLFMELILKEKDFRAALITTDWSLYRQKIVAVHCSADAIIPVWAYMLVTSYLQPVASAVFLGDEKTVLQQLISERIREINLEDYRDKRIVIKGCGEKGIGDFAYLELTKRLRPIAQSIMYGEPCSTVPIYKKPKN